MPSVRKFAEQLGVSKSPVVEAYDRLAAEGLVEARRGSGFYVATASSPLVLAAAPPVVLYAFLMDYYIAGLTAGATKG